MFIMNLIHRYYTHTLNCSRGRFIFEIALASITVRILFGFLIGALAISQFSITSLPAGPADDFMTHKYSYVFIIILSTILGPFLETFTQWIPIVFLKKITTNYIHIILITGLIFAALHLSYGVLYALVVFPSGLALSWSFYIKYKKSLSEAFLTTFTIHSIHNMISIFFIILPLITGD